MSRGDKALKEDILFNGSVVLGLLLIFSHILLLSFQSVKINDVEQYMVENNIAEYKIDNEGNKTIVLKEITKNE